MCVCVCVCNPFKIYTNVILPVRLDDGSSVRHSCSSTEIVCLSVVKLIFLHLQTAAASFPLGLQEAARISRQHMKVARLSALRTGHPYNPREHPWY
jgi:hypothetical protein